MLSDASAQSACAATAVCVKAGARRDGGGGEGGDGGGRGGGGHEARSLLAEEACVAAARSLRNIVGVSRRDPSGVGWRWGLAAPAARARAAETRAPRRPPHRRTRARRSTPLGRWFRGRGRGLTRLSSRAWRSGGVGEPGGGRWARVRRDK